MTQPRVLQRAIWSGTPQELAVWWTLRREATRGHAICRMFSHQLGHELRLEVKGELIASKVCRDDDEILRCQEEWRKGFEEKGWSKS
jgi:hypothetical protein